MKVVARYGYLLAAALTVAGCTVNDKSKYTFGGSTDEGGGSSGAAGTGAHAGSSVAAGTGGRAGSSAAGSSTAGDESGEGGVLGEGGENAQGGSSGNPGAGEAGAGGRGGGIPQDPCSLPDNSFACLQASGKGRRVCLGGSWQAAASCAASENCGTPTGTCKAIIPECLSQPGFHYCNSTGLRATCGPDVVSVTTETCVGKCVSGQCASASCGDGVLQPNEACDDGNLVNTDDCTNGCTKKRCGDGYLQLPEVCDDENSAAGDGCSATCTLESGWLCSGTPSKCATKCGDGITAGTEACDDRNTVAGDGCSATCTLEAGWKCSGAPSTCGPTCGDGIVAGSEKCDDRNTVAGDGCSATCTLESGWKCNGAPSACGPTCADGIVVGTEACDDRNTVAGDGCSATCTLETGWRCSGAPSACAPICGDARVTGPEPCDDGNTVNTDACTNQCTCGARLTGARCEFNRYVVITPTSITADSCAQATNSNGSAVTGTEGSNAFVWTQAAGSKSLLLSPLIARTSAMGMSSDGSVIVGNFVSSTTGSLAQAYRWTQQTGVIALASTGTSNELAWGVSGDGATVVGATTRFSGSNAAFRWTSGTGMTRLTAGGGTASAAVRISRNGSTIAGWGTDAGGSDATLVWAGTSAPQTFVAPIGYAGTGFGWLVADGSALFGYFSPLAGPGTVFKWTATGGALIQAATDSAQWHAFEFATSSDGNVQMGQSANGAYVLDLTNGPPRLLADILASEGVSIPAGTFLRGFGVSDDGNAVVGCAQPASGPMVAFVAHWR